MKTVLIPVTIVILVVLQFSCKENPTAPVYKGNPPTTNQHSLIPLFIGNIWAYADSMLVDSTLTNRALEVYSITDFSNQSGQIWWKQTYDNLSTEYSITNDSVYSRQFPNSPPVLIFVPPPPIGDTLHYLRTLPDLPTDTITVFQMSSPFVTQCGTFDSVVVYEVRTFFRHTTTYIKPQLGVLRIEHYSDLYSSVLEKVDLVYYRLSF